MNLLVVGGGGREHALVWKLASEPSVDTIWSVPGNPGTAAIARRADLSAGDLTALATLAEREGIDLTVVGPELPLDRGIVDLFRSRGLRIFGPTRAAAQLECSKVFAKAFMARHGIPTARYRACDSAHEAHAIVASGELGFPIVVKADGLAAGKGVVVASDRESADLAIHAAMEDKQFGNAGSRVVLEECLDGPEVSFFAICDGTRASALMSAQDHKRVFDSDEGPNTGGMGAFAPSPLVDSGMQTRIMREIVTPVIAGLAAEGNPYQGFLYAGLMLTCDGPKVIEFNVRFGDPEAQVVIPMIADELAPRLVAAADGALDPRPINFSTEAHVGVVLASRDYPASGPVGLPIVGLGAARAQRDVLVFHAGTAARGDEIVTAGGRVLTVVGRGPTYGDAIARAYAGVSKISFDGMHYRRDIGQKALTLSPKS
ncbi:MAG TPA: phosphoribosylamine--glycine ligase [Vicinamibacterales bacterium]|nr:phosphoribosylamine--glycine ligase [Vicinamibacterales bacterium]